MKVFDLPLWRAALLAVAVTTASGCNWPDPELAPNQDPVVQAILVDGEDEPAPVVREGQKVVLQAVIWDPNGDEVPSQNITWSFTDGSVDGPSDGSSVVWEAPFVIWESPPQEVMVDARVLVDDGREGTAEQTITLRVLPPCREDNQAPVIRGITADPSSIPLKESTIITADVEDPEGDALTYEWIVPFGYTEGNGPQIRWVTTETCCRDLYPVQLIVSDGCDASWGKTDVEVIP